MIEKPSVERSGVIGGASRNGSQAIFPMTIAVNAPAAIPASKATGSGKFAAITVKPMKPPSMNNSPMARLRIERIPMTSENDSATSV